MKKPQPGQPEPQRANVPPTSSALVRNESLRRGLAVMQTLADARRSLPASEVARATGIPGATVARLLATLADERMAERDSDGAWRPGPGIAGLAGLEGHVVAMISQAPEVLRRLADDTGETAMLTRVRLPDTVETLVEEHAGRLLGVTDWVGRIFDPRRSVAGWITAAALDDEAVSSIAGDDTTGFVAAVADARFRGYGFDVDGLEEGLTSLAVSVPSTVVGMAVGVAGPSSRLTPEHVPPVIERMRLAADELADRTVPHDRTPGR